MFDGIEDKRHNMTRERKKGLLCNFRRFTYLYLTVAALFQLSIRVGLIPTVTISGYSSFIRCLHPDEMKAKAAIIDPKNISAVVESSKPIEHLPSSKRIRIESPSNRLHAVSVDQEDYIYSDLGSPVVVEPHRLIFFYIPKNGCTLWQKLFRRMMGYEDWKTKEPYGFSNGLVYLHQLNRSYASDIMNSPDYTRAIILRDPKERLLSAYLDKVKSSNGGWYFLEKCCQGQRSLCWDQAQTFRGFFEIAKTCEDFHWRPQSQRVDEKYLPFLNFVGHMETIQDDAKELLTRIGAWEDFGISGWGVFGNESIFQSKSDITHWTTSQIDDSRKRLSQYYTPELEKNIEEMYAEDYMIPLFNLTKSTIDFRISKPIVQSDEVHD